MTVQILEVKLPEYKLEKEISYDEVGGKVDDLVRKNLPNGAYRNGFWIEDVDTGVLMCRGIFGQLIYSDPGHDLTVVQLATWPEPQSDRRGAEARAAIHAIRDRLHGA